MRSCFAAVLALAACAAVSGAEVSNAGDALLDRLVGQWVLRGTIAGSETTHDVSAEWVLGRGYVQLHEVSREKDASGAPAYEAIVFISYGPGRGEYTCLWLDTTGNGGLVPHAFGHASAGANEIPFIFHGASGEVNFQNTFAYDAAADSWAWILDGVQDGSHEPFGRVTLARR